MTTLFAISCSVTVTLLVGSLYRAIAKRVNAPVAQEVRIAKLESCNDDTKSALQFLCEQYGIQLDVNKTILTVLGDDKPGVSDMIGQINKSKEKYISFLSAAKA